MPSGGMFPQSPPGDQVTIAFSHNTAAWVGISTCLVLLRLWWLYSGNWMTKQETPEENPFDKPPD